MAKSVLQKQLFYSKICTLQDSYKNVNIRRPMTTELVNSIINKIQCDIEIPAGEMESLSEYEVRTFNGKNVLIQINKKLYRIVVPLEESYDILQKAHLDTNHGNVTIMTQWLENNNYLVYKPSIEVFIESCLCTKEIKKPSEQGETNKIEPKFSVVETAVVDFLHITSDEEFAYIVIVQYRPSNFIQLRALRTLDRGEIVVELYTLFMDIAVPREITVHSDWTKMFEKILPNLKKLCCSNFFLNIYTDPNPLKSKVLDHLEKWMGSNNVKNWAFGSNVVQWEMNNEKNADGTVPYSEMFKNNLWKEEAKC